MIHKITIFAFLVILAIGASSFGIERTAAPQDDNIQYLAQAEPDTTQPPKDMPMHPGEFEKQGEFGPGPKKFERLRMRKLIQLLGLEGEVKGAFVAIVQKYRYKRQTLMRTHKAIVDSLAIGIRTGSLEEKGIEEFIGRLDDMEARQAKMREEFRDEVRPLLDAEQYGKLVVFEFRFEAQILDRLNKFRKRGGGPPAGMPKHREDIDTFFDNDSI